VSNKPAQLHQKRSIIGEESVKYFEFGIAAKRWLKTHSSEFKGQPITLLGDDLYSHQPMYEQILAVGMNFIFTFLETSHTGLYDWLKYLDGIGEVKNWS
jgi:hypothetical protein